MNINQRTYNISNEHLLLIDILNTMYNDNLRQITNLTDSNQQIRNLIIQILNTNGTQRRNNINNNNNNINNNYRNNNQRNIYRENNISNGDLSNRVYLNYLPYIPYIPYNIDNTTQNRNPINQNSRNVNLNNNELFSRVLQGFFDPVEVYPTPSQIETATRRVRYCDIVSPKNTSCPISLTSFTDNDMVTVIRHCGHIFNTDELNTWFRGHCSCPVCRYDIREDNSNASSVFSSENNNSINNTSTSSTSSNNQSNNNSSNSSEERNYTSSLVNILFNSIMSDYDIINSLNYTDASGNGDFSGPSRLFRQLNSRNNPQI
jgi:hypothetical protein